MQPMHSGPFAKYPRSKKLKEAEQACIRLRCKGAPPEGMTYFNAILAWHYGRRTKEEQLFFGGGIELLETAMYAPHPFFDLLPKDYTFKGRTI